jgi:DNA-directed RNA polymerase specialized sigma24 family protein
MAAKFTPPHVSFSKEMKQELAEPEAGGRGLARVKEHLRVLARDFKKKMGWENQGLTREELAEKEDDALNDVLADLCRRYREKNLPSRFTEEAATAVINQVRNFCRRERAWQKRKAELDKEEQAELAKEPIFDPAVDQKVQVLEKLFELGAIDKIEYYFLFATQERETLRKAARLIGCPEGTARSCAHYARKKAKEALQALAENRPVKVKDQSKGGRPRHEVPDDVLHRAIRFIATR